MSTYAEQLAEAKRELGLRQRVYKRWVLDGSLLESDATRQMTLMADIVQTLKRLAEQESGQQALFGGE